MQGTIERYGKHTKDNQANNKSVSTDQNEQLKQEASGMMKQIEHLEVSKRKLLGETVGLCTIEELQQLEQQLESSVNRIRARKTQVFKEQIEQLREKERVLTAENERLFEKCGAMQQREPETKQGEKLAFNESSPSSDVETELFIGLPERRSKH